MHEIGFRPTGICNYPDAFPFSSINPIIQYSSQIITGHSIVYDLSEIIPLILKSFIKTLYPQITDYSYNLIRITVDPIFVGILDGNISPETMTNFFESAPDTTTKNAYKLYLEIHSIVSGICDCFYSSLNNFSNIQFCLTKVIEQYTKNNPQDGDFRQFGQYSDTASFEYINCVKNLVSGIDQLTKLIHVYSKIFHKKPPKIEDKMASELLHIINKNTGLLYLKPLVRKISYLITMRNELTHNRALSMLRYPVFVGMNTPRRPLPNTPYCDALTWDRTRNGQYLRTGKLCGFVTQQKCALTELQAWLRNSYRLAFEVFNHITQTCPK